MDKIEFIERYANSQIEIKFNPLALEAHRSTLREKANRLMDICRELRLDCGFAEGTYVSDVQLCLISDSTSRIEGVPSTHSYEIFIAAWELVLETERKEKEQREQEEYERVKISLHQLSIETEKITKVTNNPEYLQYIKEKGYIQSITTRAISLWWHVDGGRVAFVYKKGIFKLD